MPLSPERSASLRLAGILVLALASWWLPKLALPACFLVLLVALSLPRLKRPALRIWARTIIVLAGLLASGAFVGFVLHEAIPGVIAGGNQDTEKRAIALLRTIVVAEDKMREKALIDPDKDGIGSAGSLSELTGRVALRNGARVDILPLYVKPTQFVEATGVTLVSHGAYLIKLCLPNRLHGFSAGEDVTEVDAEASETKFYAYAWPRSFGAGSPHTTYFIDAEERILVHAPKGAMPVHYQGVNAGPECGAIDSSPDDWVAWKDKAARATLPGAGTHESNSAR
jgi:hypothetical protein